MQVYSDPSREADPWSLPDAEVWFNADDTELEGRGYYYWFCLPGCMPDSEPCGPFDTEAEAIAAARDTGE
jgi:hypothetical protein